MFAFVILAVSLVSVINGQQPQNQLNNNNNQRPVYQPAQIHYVNIGQELNGDYKFGYDTGKGPFGQSFREEARLPDGTVKGSYGYLDANNQQRIIKYTAGVNGFVVDSDTPASNQGAAPASAPARQVAAPAPAPAQQSSPFSFNIPQLQNTRQQAPVAPVAQAPPALPQLPAHQSLNGRGVLPRNQPQNLPQLPALPQLDVNNFNPFNNNFGANQFANNQLASNQFGSNQNANRFPAFNSFNNFPQFNQNNQNQYDDGQYRPERYAGYQAPVGRQSFGFNSFNSQPSASNSAAFPSNVYNNLPGVKLITINHRAQVAAQAAPASIPSVSASSNIGSTAGVTPRPIAFQETTGPAVINGALLSYNIGIQH